MIEIFFEAHSTTIDNEAKLASGYNDIELSDLGIKQSHELGDRHKNDHFDAIFCSDLQRSYKTAEIAFENKYPIIKDMRLRECDYGDFTQKPKELVDSEKIKRINTPFPNGESYIQTTERIQSFLDDIKQDYDGKKIMIIGHRATQYGLDCLLNGLTIEEAITKPWKWQPGWNYILN